jgi:hypothetical protein
LLFVALVLGIMGFGVYRYLWRPNDPMNGQKADFQVLAHEWVEEFKINEQAANQKYMGRIVEAKGVVREILTDSLGGLNIILETGDSFMGVNCSMESGQVKPSKGNDTLLVRGEFSAYTLDVCMSRCIVVDKSK